VERLAFAAVAPLNRVGDGFSHWTAPGAIRVLPCQTILLPGRADDALRVLIHAGTLTLQKRVLMLRLDKAMANLNGIQFISPDPTVQELPTPGFRIKRPLSVGFHDRYGKRPIIITDGKNR